MPEMTGIERLRELAWDMNLQGLWSAIRDEKKERWYARYGDGATVNGLLRAIADQIEAEQEERVTRRVEDREAAEWVREHGGIAYVKDAWNVRSNLDRQLEKAQAKVERQQRHIRHIQRLCRERRERIAELDKTIVEMRPRLMPEGMEWLVEAWPRFEDDGPVRFLDDFERCGDENGIAVVTMYSDGSFALNFRAYSKGERVRRPAILAADGEKLEAGQTVWHVDTGHEYVVVEPSYGKTVVVRLAKYDDAESEQHAPDKLTHERPDSWERWRKDFLLPTVDYCMEVIGMDGYRDMGLDDVFDVQARDMERRAKALAERGAR